MKKYSRDLVEKYINGEDIEDYSLDELENDKNFMMLVISQTTDRKMYNYCSESVKSDYEFVKYVILKFKGDINFITQVADHFFDNKNLYEERLELSIIMSDLTKGDPELSEKYAVMREGLYLLNQVKVDIIKRAIEDPKAADKIGEGFFISYDSYNHSEIILNFLAKKCIKEIFEKHNLEKALHNDFTSPEEIDKSGLNVYLLKIIGMYDQTLASYVATHIKLLNDARENVKKIQRTWVQYKHKEEAERYEIMLERVHEYMKQFNSAFDETFLLYYIGNELGISDKIAEYDCVDEELYESIMDDIRTSSEEYVEINLGDFNERVHYNTVEKIMRETIFGKNYELEENPDEQDKPSNSPKVITLNFKNKKN